MPTRSAKRKRGDLERTFDDDSSEVSESGTSGSSFELSDNGEDTDSSANYVDVVKSARKGSRKNFSTRKIVKEGNTNLKKSDTQGKICRGSIMTSAPGKVEEGSKLKLVNSENFDSQHEPRDIKKRKIDLESSSSTSKLTDQANNRVKGLPGAAELEGNENSTEIKSSDCAKNRGLTSTNCIGNVKSKEKDKKVHNVNQETSLRKGKHLRVETKSDVCRNLNSSRRILYDKRLIEQVCNRLREGDSVKTIADELGIRKTTIHGWRLQHFSEKERKEMIKKWPRKTQHDKQTIEQVCRRLREGASAKTVAQEFGVKKSNVFNWQRKFAPEVLRNIPGHSPHSEETILEVCKELKKGVLSKNKIALKIGIMSNTVTSWERKYLLAKLQETTPEGSWEYDRYTKLEACNRLKKGESLDIIAKKLDIPNYALRKWESEISGSIVSTPDNGYKYNKEFKLNVCKRFLQGEPMPSIAKELGISPSLIHSWKYKYCTSELPEPSDGHKYNKDTILQACELLKSGEEVKDVTKKLRVPKAAVSAWKEKYLKKEKPKFNSLSAVLHLARKCYSKRLVLDAFRLLKQGDSSGTIAKKLKVNVTLVLKWQRKYFIKKVVTKDDLKMSQRLRESFTIGDPTRSISMKFRTNDLTIDKLRCKYLEEVSSRFLEKMKTSGQPIDAKLESQPIVVLQMAQEVDKLCQVPDVHPYTAPIQHIDKTVLRQALNRLKNGVSSKVIAEELGVLEQRVERWKMKYISRKKRVIKKSIMGGHHEVLREAVYLMKKGARTIFLTKRYGVKEDVIYNWRKRYAAETLRPILFRSNVTLLKACRELKKGGTVISVALEMGLPFKKIRSWQAEYLTRRLRETTSQGSCEYDRYTKLEAWEQIKRGVATEVIARDLSVNVYLVRKWKSGCAGTRRQKGLQLKPDCSSLNKRKSKKRKLAKIFIPLRKVHIPMKMKLRFVQMIDEGVPIKKLSKDLNVNELTLKSWVHNRDFLLKRSSAEQERNNN